MNCMLFLAILSTQIFSVNLQLEGAWSNKTEDGNTHILLFSGPYFTHTIHQTKNGAFVMTKGGTWQLDGKKINYTYEFHTQDSSLVGQTESQTLKSKDAGFQFKGNGSPKGIWKAIDDVDVSDLKNTWLFSGRKRNGELKRRDTNRPRKTMKVLTGSRFQWIAYNTETKQFFGTGGGTYTAKDGIYTENIEFFSRDNQRVGASLQFSYDMIDGEWHHSGKSSKGDPMYEIWSNRK